MLNIRRNSATNKTLELKYRGIRCMMPNNWMNSAQGRIKSKISIFKFSHPGNFIYYKLCPDRGIILGFFNYDNIVKKYTYTLKRVHNI
jgi:hypothetical protein